MRGGLLLGVLSSCSGGGGGMSSVCVTGSSIACACTNGGTGAQTCSANGSGYGMCVCANGSSMGGSVGTGGSGGAGGAASGSGGLTGTGGHDQNADAGMQAKEAATSDGSVTTAPPTGYTGRFATVIIEDALIGPGKVDGSSWDPGSNTIPPGVFDDLNRALAEANPFAAALAVIGEPLLTNALDSFQKPDCYGTMRLDALGQVGTEYWLVTRDLATQDSYTPSFPGPVGFTGVPIDTDVRLTLHLWDADALDADDEVGVAVINGPDMRAALDLQQKAQVAVWDQTNQQILFFGITVEQQ
jgi:hypothetical protein